LGYTFLGSVSAELLKKGEECLGKFLRSRGVTIVIARKLVKVGF
jgi:hypothetical protein